MANPKKAAAAADVTQVQIPGVKRGTMDVWLVGDSPLILHAWDKWSRADMLRKQMGKPTQKKRAKDPTALVNECFYLSRAEDMPHAAQVTGTAGATGDRYAFPTTAIKRAAVGAGRFVETKMTEIKGMIFVLGDFVPIHGSDPVAREDMVRVGMGTADIRYRPMFERWALPLRIEYNAGFVQPEQIVNLLETAGFGIGLGEWRPEHNGPFGRFHVARGSEARAFEKQIPEVKTLVIDVEFPAESGLELTTDAVGAAE